MRRRRAYRHSGPRLVSPYGREKATPRWRRLVGCFCLLAALCLTLASAALVFSAPLVSLGRPPVETEAAQQPRPTLPPETIIAIDSAPARPDPDGPGQRPTISPARMLELLATPPDPAAGPAS